MSKFVWTDDFSVGNNAMDADHQKLVEMINDLDVAINLEASIEYLSEILSRLVEYTQTHFQREEALLESLGFAEFDAHKAQHHELLDIAHDFNRQFSITPSFFKMEEILDLLTDWLKNHILQEDMKYKNLSK